MLQHSPRRRSVTFRQQLVQLLLDVADAIDSPVPCNAFDRPIFIIAPPRSGSTFLFECLARSREVHHIGHEADGIWWRVFPYGRAGPPSDFVSAECASRSAVRSILRRTYTAAALVRVREYTRTSWPFHLIRYSLGLKRIRYLDKTVANCFHLGFLEKAFPNAQYVLLVRDPRPGISSMMEGWSHTELVGKPQLTPVLRGMDEATIEHWSYPAPPGWQEMVSRPLVQICAWSWQQHVEHALSFFDSRPARPVMVRYEDLVADSLDTITALADDLDLTVTEGMRSFALARPESKTTITRPRQGKWLAANRDQIESIVPMVATTAEKIGYHLSSGTYNP